MLTTEMDSPYSVRLIEHLAIGLLLLLGLVISSNGLIVKADTTTTVSYIAPSSATTTIRKFPKVVTSSGEIPVDSTTGKLLPEELDDGELEGGDKLTEWSYNDQSGWAREYPCCRGKQMRQSPIDIQTDSVTLKPGARLEFVDYDQSVKFQLKNTHHSMSMMPITSNDTTPTIRVSWLPDDDFELQEIHFHWGDGVNKGSEHEINDQKAAAEMHMVHYKKGLKKEDIGSIDNSVLVVGVLIESDQVEHNELEILVGKASNVNGTDREYICDNQSNLINLLPNHHQSFYYYNGSLTTPPCYETVTWIIMSEPVYMSNDRLVELTNLETQTHKGKYKISANHREIQPLLDRPVYVSFNTTESISPKLRKRFNNYGSIGKELINYKLTVSALKETIRNSWLKIDEARNRLYQRLRALGGYQQQQQYTPTTSR